METLSQLTENYTATFLPATASSPQRLDENILRTDAIVVPAAVYHFTITIKITDKFLIAIALTSSVFESRRSLHA